MIIIIIYLSYTFLGSSLTQPVATDKPPTSELMISAC